MLRLKDNSCHLQETVRALRRHHKLSELVIFYNARELHVDALNLLKENHDKPESSISGHMRTVQYMQNLGPANIDVILQFAGWVLNVNETDGLTIFTEDMPEVEALPRSRVLDFLKKSRPSAVISYLKHVIVTWKDENPVFHNALALRYKDRILEYMEARTSASMVEELRAELQELLESSTHCTPALILPEFPTHCLQEERAILLGRLFKHREALTLYLYHVKDVDKAKKYCQRHYSSDKDVYTVLVELLLSTPDKQILNELGIDSKAATFKHDVNVALDILEEFSVKVDLAVALKYLPDSVKLSRIGKFLTVKLEERVTQKHKTLVQKSLLHSEHLQVQKERMEAEKEMIVIGEFDICRVCHKRFTGSGAFVRLPNSEIVHYSCQEKAYDFF